MKTRTFLILSMTLLVSLACALPSQSNNESAPQDPSLSPIDAHTGVHVYHVVPASVTCNLGDQERDEARTITFAPGQVEITNANKPGTAVYDEIAENTYHRINADGRPIVITFSSTGFLMEVFEIDGDNNAVCGYYTFTIKE